VIQALRAALLFPLDDPDPEHLKANRAFFESQMDPLHPSRSAPQGCANRTLPLEIVPMANIIETAKGAGLFSTLLTAVEVAGLTGALESPGRSRCLLRWTTPSPALLPAPCRPWVQNPPQLARILKFHVISGAYSRSDLVDQPSWESLEGAMIPIRCAEPFEVKNTSVLSATLSVTTASCT